MIAFMKGAWDKVSGVFEWTAEAYADVVGNYPKMAFGLMLFLLMAALV